MHSFYGSITCSVWLLRKRGKNTHRIKAQYIYIYLPLFGLSFLRRLSLFISMWVHAVWMKPECRFLDVLGWCNFLLFLMSIFVFFYNRVTKNDMSIMTSDRIEWRKWIHVSDLISLLRIHRWPLILGLKLGCGCNIFVYLGFLRG